MFSTWKQEKAVASLVDEAQVLLVKLTTAKPHILESHAAAAQFWSASYLADGQNLHELMVWKPAAIARFVVTAQTKIAALRKKREYDSSDGLAIWLHAARAVAEPRIAPVVRDIWQLILNAGPNADAMAQDQMQDAGISVLEGRKAPAGFGVDNQNSRSIWHNWDHDLKDALGSTCPGSDRQDQGPRFIGAESGSRNRTVSCAVYERPQPR